MKTCNFLYLSLKTFVRLTLADNNYKTRKYNSKCQWKNTCFSWTQAKHFVVVHAYSNEFYKNSNEFSERKISMLTKSISVSSNAKTLLIVWQSVYKERQGYLKLDEIRVYACLWKIEFSGHCRYRFRNQICSYIISKHLRDRLG